MEQARRRIIQGLGAGLLSAGAGLSWAQEPWPSRPLRMVVPFPPGGLTDVLGRAIAERLSGALGQPVVVENKPGAGTLTGAESVAKAPADGYTLLVSTSTTFGIAPALYKNPPIDPLRDFQPVSLIGTVNFFLIANPSFPANSVQDLIDVVRANPGKYNYASVGNGSAHHLFMEDLKRRYGLQMQHIAYKGTGAALTDVLSGNVQAMFCDSTAAVPNIRAGKVKALGTTAAKQNALIPAVPPIGRTVEGFDWQAWQGVSVAAATPAPIVARLSNEMQRFQQTDEFRAFLAKIGMEPWPHMTPAEFAAHVRTEKERWAEAVRVSGAKID
ncbi:MAG TPA: tripartite tricarboxylate transporter substrate binding protein [Burkholderiales bacterium]|nr:tripartite tricarboxylate transporter substrate binding protein [Burkholderiales bacterium]